MATNSIVLKGTTYNGVSSIELPTSSNGTALFTDVSDTTAVASDVASGKYFYTALGALTEGTASGGGGGGLEYESGTWTPSEDVADYTITFTNTHTNPPFHYEIFDATGDDVGTDASNLCVVYTNWYYAFGEPIYYNGSTARYGEIRMGYKNSATTMGTSTQNITSASETTWASSTGIRAYVNNISRYWRTDRTYKWIAIWAPTS